MVFIKFWKYIIIDNTTEKYLVVLLLAPENILKPPNILTLNICVVIYHQNFENLVINEDVKNDLKERCYIAKNKEELEFILIEYGNGNLPTKWSNYFLDKYIFPTNNISPGKEIANYINSIT